jgi:hypothetical protein
MGLLPTRSGVEGQRRPATTGSARAISTDKGAGRCRIAPGARQARRPATYALLLPKALSLMAGPARLEISEQGAPPQLRGRARLKMLLIHEPVTK